MKHTISFICTTVLALMLLTACESEAQQNKKSNAAGKGAAVEVIQFHSEHRCMTCNKIEKLTKETLEGKSGVTFKLVNVESKENKAMAEEFEAFGTSLYLYDAGTGKKKNLTDFAFMNAGNEASFKSGLLKELAAFSKAE